MGLLFVLMAGGVIYGNTLEAGKSFLCAGAPTALAASLDAGAAAKPARIAQSGTTGTRRALVLFARFKGESTALPSWAVDIFNPDLPGSFSHFYDTMSFGKLQVRGEVAPRVYESAQPASAYLADDQIQGDEFGRFSLEILRQADVVLDFAQYDNDGPDGVPNSGDDDGVVDAVFIVLDKIPADFLKGEATGISYLGLQAAFDTKDPGAGGRAIQVQSNSGTIQQGRSFGEAMGAMCHEYGHVLGLPDLYNTDFFQQAGTGPEADGAGVGAWCLMGWGASGWNGNDGPNSLCAWSRMKLGWAKVRTADREHQEVRLAEVGKRGQVVRVPLTGQEYFLLEHRRRTSTYYDRNIPGEGLLIWQVGTRRQEGELTSQLVLDLECADGRWTDAGYPAGKVPDPQKGEDNLDFWAHDGGYAQAHRGNLGDATDPFDGVRYTAFTPESNPSSHSQDGWLSARIEDIHLEEDILVAQVQTTPLVVEFKGVDVEDADGDGLILAGERLRVRFQLANIGGLPARELKVRLRSDDPQVELIEPEVQLPDLEPGKTTFGQSTEGKLSLRLRDDFYGIHQATVVVEILAGQVLAGQYLLSVVGISPRQQVSRVSVANSLGNSDGAAQIGEFIRLRLELAGVEQAEMLKAFDFFLWPLQEEVRLVSSARVRFGWDGKATASQQSPEFLLSDDLAPGRALDFEFEGRGAFGSWKDTVSVVLQPGPDQTPPRVLGIQTRPVREGVQIALPLSQVQEGGEVRRAEAHIYAQDTISEKAVVPLSLDQDAYTGIWKTQEPGIYLIAGMVEDQAGNQGQSRLQPFPVLPGVESPASPAKLWEELPLPHEGNRPLARHLFLAPGNPEVLYASTTQGLWRTLDRGASWERLGIMREVYSLLIDAVDPFTLYTTISGAQGEPSVLKSQDGGSSWQEGASSIIPMAADPLRPGRLYGYGYERQRLMISEDGGQSWKETSLPGPFQSIEVHPRNPEYLYVGATGLWDEAVGAPLPSSVWHSADSGQTWEQQQLDRHFTSVTLDPHSEEALYATSSDTLWHSADRGATWKQLAVLGSEGSFIFLKTHPADPDLLYAMQPYSGPLWRSRDAGQTWEKLTLPYGGPMDLALDPRDPNRLFAAIVSLLDRPSLVHSADAGDHWDQILLPELNPAIGTVLFDESGRLYAGSGRMIEGDGERSNILPGFYLSQDQGRRWEWQGTALRQRFIRYSSSEPSIIDVLFMDPLHPQFLLASMDAFMVRSANGGRDWQMVENIIRSFGAHAAILADPRYEGVYYLAAQGLLRTADFGENWEDYSAGLPRENNIFGPAVNDMVLDLQREPARLIAAVADSLWQRNDQSQSWEYLSQVRPGQRIQHLAFHPLDSRKLYAVTTGGLYWSADQGQSWAVVRAQEAGNWYKVRLRFDALDPRRFFLVTGDQLLETHDGGQNWNSLGEGLAARPQFNDVAIDPLDPEVIYAATPWGVYRLDTRAAITAVEDEQPRPAIFALAPNYPNPFNPTTTIRFSLPQRGEAELSIYNLLGQRVATLVRGVQETGSHVLQWDGRDDTGRELASGVYFYRLQAGSQVETRKLLLLR